MFSSFGLSEVDYSNIYFVKLLVLFKKFSSVMLYKTEPLIIFFYLLSAVTLLSAVCSLHSQNENAYQHVSVVPLLFLLFLFFLLLSFFKIFSFLLLFLLPQEITVKTC